MQIPYEYLGKVFVFLSILAFCATGLALLIGAYSFKKHRIIFPNFILFMLYLFYSPARWTCRRFRIRDTLVDDILIEIRNASMLERFIHTKERRVVLLPQCMRHPECKARCDPVHGYECKRCGKCDIAKICEAGDRYNFEIFVIPGGSFVKKIFKEYRPKACLGVACYNELAEDMQEVAFIPVQGVLLLKDGCFNTEANVEEIIQKMEMCDV
ncbi:MAG: DUF116 domain-containing protein [Methanosarcinaceae archaeon]|nr:DUF116 domain-containing protein [Methanosarcinaceae archaeon]MDD4331309.1 DUF116 domain-containing protein [Methanosarcinaceae archaeon]MDD4748546.1 DUF116 domain-containing protein [Methanosarcinaceae archaeon]